MHKSWKIQIDQSILSSYMFIYLYYVYITILIWSYWHLTKRPKAMQFYGTSDIIYIEYVYLFTICIYYHFDMILMVPNENNKGHAILWDVRPIYNEYSITFWRWWDHMPISHTLPKNNENLTFMSRSHIIAHI